MSVKPKIIFNICSNVNERDSCLHGTIIPAIILVGYAALLEMVVCLLPVGLFWMASLPLAG